MVLSARQAKLEHCAHINACHVSSFWYNKITCKQLLSMMHPVGPMSTVFGVRVPVSKPHVCEADDCPVFPSYAPMNLSLALSSVMNSHDVTVV